MYHVAFSPLTQVNVQYIVQEVHDQKMMASFSITQTNKT